MELSTFAYTIGILEILIGLPLVFYPKPARKWLDKMLKEELSMRMIGALLAVVAALVLIEDYTVDLTPVGLVLLVAWLTFFKGIMWAWWPQTAVQMKKKWFKGEGMITFGGLAATAIGVLLIYGGTILQ